MHVCVCVCVGGAGGGGSRKQVGNGEVRQMDPHTQKRVRGCEERGAGCRGTERQRAQGQGEALVVYGDSYPK